jgi:hypothetical protein
MLPAVTLAGTADDRRRTPLLTVYFDDPQVATAMGVVELFMEHDETPLAIVGAPQDLHSRAVPTGLLRRHADGVMAA